MQTEDVLNSYGRGRHRFCRVSCCPPTSAVQGDVAVKMAPTRTLGQISRWTVVSTMPSFLRMRIPSIHTLSHDEPEQQPIGPRIARQTSIDFIALAAAISVVIGLNACARAASSATGTPLPKAPAAGRTSGGVAAPVSGLPAVPVVRGAPIDLKVRYPS